MATATKTEDLEALFEQKRREMEELQEKLNTQRREQATKTFEEVMETLEANVEYFSLAQKNSIVNLVKPDAPRAKGSGGSKGTVKAKYQAGQEGPTWTGRGKHIPNSFIAWKESAEGRKWFKDNPIPEGVQERHWWPAFPFDGKPAEVAFANIDTSKANKNAGKVATNKSESKDTANA